MGHKNLLLPILFLIAITLAFSSLARAGDAANCAFAHKIAEKAASEFKANKNLGLRHFLQAHKYCPDDAVINFDLGLAFFRYGNLKDAESYLKIAVSMDGSNADWLNLLSWVMLERGTDRVKALEYAEKAAKINPDSPAIYDTLILAYLENHQLYNAVASAHKAKGKWPGNKKILKRYSEAIDTYIAFYLKKTKAGMHEQAISGLKKVDFDPEVVKAYCWALFVAGRTDQALERAYKAGNKDVFAQIMDRFVQRRYQEFKQGKRAEALGAVDKMRQRYPGHKGLEKAYTRMFNAILADADTITVPEPMKIAPSGKASGQGSRLLSEIQGGAQAPVEKKTSLMVDVDIDIPKAGQKDPDGVAVIIGNMHYSRYRHGIPDVRFALRDAGYMRKYVINELGYSKDNIIYITDATHGDMARIFGTAKDFRGQLFNWVKKGKSDVFIYYTGHGAPDPGGKGAFLMPVDADADYISANGYSLNTFYNNLARIPARKITVVMDACFSGNSETGMLVKNISPGMLKTANPVRKIKKAVIFASAGKDQVSHWYPEKMHSLFTYFFMKGLRGAADSNRDKRITVSEMKAYLLAKVPYRARRLTGREQVPIVVGDETREIARLR